MTAATLKGIMKRTILLLIMLFPAICHAQRTAANPLGGNITVQDAGTCSTTNSFLWQVLPSNSATTTVNLSGTFSGTVTVRESNNGGGSWSTAGTQTTVGTSSYSTNGFTDICADVTTYASGTIQITISTGLNAGPQGPPGAGGGSSVVSSTCASSMTFTTTSAFITDFFLNLNCNVTSSVMAGPFVTGSEAVFTITQATGGNTFAWPTAFLNTPPLANPAGAATVATFQYCGAIGNGNACPANSWQNTDVGPAGVAASGIQTAWQKIGPVIYGGTTDATTVQEPRVFITPTAQVVTNPASGAPVLGMFFTLGFTSESLVYRESFDGLTWFSSAISIANHAHSSVQVISGTVYLLAATPTSGTNAIDIYSGTDAGHLTLLKAAIVSSGGGGWKNNSLGGSALWHDLDGTWRLLYEGNGGSPSHWSIGEATCTVPSGTMTCTDFGSNPVITNPTANGTLGGPQSLKQVSASSYITWLHGTPTGVTGVLPSDGYFATASSPTGPWTVATNSVLYRTTAIEGVNSANGQFADLMSLTFNGSCFMYNTAYPSGLTGLNGAIELNVANTPCEQMSSVTQTVAAPPRYPVAGVDGQVIFNKQGQETGDTGLTYVHGASESLTIGGNTGGDPGNAVLNVSGKAGSTSAISCGNTGLGACTLNIFGTTTVSTLTQSGASGNGTVASNGAWSATAYQTATNCASSASPAVCGSAAAGMFVLPAAATSVTVNTTAVTANSEIIVFNDDSLGTRLSVTCNTGLDNVLVSARVAGTSFSITGSAPVTNPNCYSYLIMN